MLHPDDRSRLRDGAGRQVVLVAIILVAAACTDQPLPTGTAASAPVVPHAFPRTPNATENPNADRRVYTVQMSVGYLPHACAVENDSQVICWGGVGTPPLTRFVGPYRMVAAGGIDDCAIRADDATIQCLWGFMTPPRASSVSCR
jgi:hypothetical protein